MKEHKMFPASVSAVIFNDENQILLVSRDGKSDWHLISGWLENESISSGILREIREELGDIDVKFVDTLNTHIFNYKGTTPTISIFTLVKYFGGVISTNDDIKGYHWEWFNRQEFDQLNKKCHYQTKIMEHALNFIESDYYKSLHQ